MNSWSFLSLSFLYDGPLNKETDYGPSINKKERGEKEVVGRPLVKGPEAGQRFALTTSPLRGNVLTF